ncbi:MAG TPA: hypothetical protein VK658_11595 [Chryseolinea sp.]|nr:hypothetical protein [Chryseolinea sp.]
MKWNPRHDPFVEAGYFGYAVRAIAHRQSAASFVPSLEIWDPAHKPGEQLYERLFNEEFVDPDSAIEFATGKGHQIIDKLLEQLVVMDDPVEYVH